MVAEVLPDYQSEYAAVTAVALMLGIGSPERIRTWIHRHEADPFRLFAVCFAARSPLS